MSISALTIALDHLQLEGAIFLRGEYTEAWTYESPTGEMMASVLRPGRERLLYFHIIASGKCWVAIEGGDPHWAERGDVVVLPYGHQHRMGGTTETVCVSVIDLLTPPPWTEFPVIRHGSGGDRTDVICGYLDVDDPLFDPALGALPPIFVVRPTGAAAAWVESSLAYALQASEEGQSDSHILTRFPALLLAEVLRIHLATAPAADHGWLAALRDPVLAPALAELHGALERKWTVADSRPLPTSRVRCSTNGSATYSVARRFVTSRIGACMSRKTSWRTRPSVCTRLPAASATNRKKRSAARSNAPMAVRRHIGASAPLRR